MHYLLTNVKKNHKINSKKNALERTACADTGMKESKHIMEHPNKVLRDCGKTS